MDDRFREAERRAKQTGDPNDVARYYLERVRCGLTTETQLHFVALIGDAAANIAIGENYNFPMVEIAKCGMLRNGLTGVLWAGLGTDAVGVIHRMPGSETEKLGLIGNLLEHIRIEVLAALRNHYGGIEDSIRLESFLTRSGWLPVLEQIQVSVDRLSLVTSDTPEFSEAVQQSWRLMVSGLGAYDRKQEAQVTQRIKNRVIHQWGLH